MGILQGSHEWLGPPSSRSGSPVTTRASPVPSIGDCSLTFDIENPPPAAGVSSSGNGKLGVPGERVESVLNLRTGQWESHTQGLVKRDEVRPCSACVVDELAPNCT